MLCLYSRVTHTDADSYKDEKRKRDINSKTRDRHPDREKKIDRQTDGQKRLDIDRQIDKQRRLDIDRQTEKAGYRQTDGQRRLDIDRQTDRQRRLDIDRHTEKTGYRLTKCSLQSVRLSACSLVVCWLVTFVDRGLNSTQTISRPFTTPSGHSRQSLYFAAIQSGVHIKYNRLASRMQKSNYVCM